MRRFDSGDSAPNGMARPDAGAETDRPVYSGEVWTDARGYATVALPRSAGRLHGSLAYELRSFSPGVTANVTAELLDGRFTIATDEPHVKVAWQVSGKGAQDDTRSQQPREEET